VLRGERLEQTTGPRVARGRMHSPHAMGQHRVDSIRHRDLLTVELRAFDGAHGVRHRLVRVSREPVEGTLCLTDQRFACAIRSSQKRCSRTRERERRPRGVGARCRCPATAEQGPAVRISMLVMRSSTRSRSVENAWPNCDAAAAFGVRAPECSATRSRRCATWCSSAMTSIEHSYAGPCSACGRASTPRAYSARSPFALARSGCTASVTI